MIMTVVIIAIFTFTLAFLCNNCGNSDFCGEFMSDFVFLWSDIA